MGVNTLFQNSLNSLDVLKEIVQIFEALIRTSLVACPNSDEEYTQLFNTTIKSQFLDVLAERCTNKS